MSADVSVLKQDRVDWDQNVTTTTTNSAYWRDTHLSVLSTSATWDSVYNYVQSSSGLYGIATLGSDGKLDENLVPNLSITDTFVVTYVAAVQELCSGQSIYGNVNIKRGDVIVVAGGNNVAYNLIALNDAPVGSYNVQTDEFNGFAKLGMPTDFIRSVNGKVGAHIDLNTDDFDDDGAVQKFVTRELIDKWNSAYLSWYSASATSVLEYTNATYVNATGDSMSGDLNLVNNAGLNVDGFSSFTQPATFSSDLNAFGSVNITGDIAANGDATFNSSLTTTASALLLGDTQFGTDLTDTTVMNSQISGDMVPTIAASGTFTLGAPSRKWSELHAGVANIDDLDLNNDLNVTGVTTLSGKGYGEVLIETIETPHPELGFDVVVDEATGALSFVENGIMQTTELSSVSAGPARIKIQGHPLGVVDYGGVDQLYPDVDVDGDVAITGGLSAMSGWFRSLTATDFTSSFNRLEIRDGDLTVRDGNIIQRGGTIRVEGDIAHLEDENTYIRFAQDQMTFRCHDVNMIRLSEYPNIDDIVIFGDTTTPVNMKMISPEDEYTFFLDATRGNIGVGTNLPEVKFHMATGEMQLPSGTAGGALMLPAGGTSTRVSKPGSIRWNSETGSYEGYYEDRELWSSLGSDTVRVSDHDQDTYITLDAIERPEVDADRMGFFTAGCSAMSIQPNQLVSFAGEIQFDNVPVYETSNGTATPMEESTEFMFVYVNGKRRGIRLWDIPENMTPSDNMSTIAGEHILDIGEEGCSTGLNGKIPTQTISGTGDLYIRQPRADDVDLDFLSDAYDPDDDNDGILDVADKDHPDNTSATDTDNDNIIDEYDTDDDDDGVIDEQDINPLAFENTIQPGDHDGDDLLDEFDADHIANHGIWSQAVQNWEDIGINWEALDGQQ